MDINVIYGLKAPIQFELIRHDSDAAIRLESVNPDKISNRLFSSAYYDTYKSISGDRSVSVGDMKTGVSSMTFAGSDATVSGAAMAEENFYLYDSVSGHSIKSVTARVGSSDATSECISYDSDSGRYIVKMKQGIIIDVTSEPETVHKVTVRGTSDDFSLYAIAVADRYDSGTKDWYSSEARNMRYANQSCTDVLANGNSYKRVKDNGYTSSDGKTVSFVNYHLNNSVNWYMSLIAYGTMPDTTLSANSNVDQFTEIFDTVITRDSDGTDVTDLLDVNYGTKSGNAYLRFMPPAYDVTVTFQSKIKLNMKHIYIHDVRPTLLDTVFVHYLYGNGNLVYTPGTADSLPEMVKGGSHDSLEAYPPGNNAYYFPSDRLELTTDMGLYQPGKTYKYRGNNSNGIYDDSTMVGSWLVYEADENGEKIGDPLNFDIVYPGDTEGDYIKYIESNATSGVGTQIPFKMPDKNIVIEVIYTKTVGACLFKQQIANSDGTLTDAGDNFSATFTGTPRDSQTHAFYGGDTVTLTGAKNGLGIYSGTKDVVMSLTPKEGYVVSSVKFKPKVNNADHGGSLTRSGNVFTVPNTIIERRWPEPYSGNGVSYFITVTYTQANTLTVKQSTDGDTLAGSSATMSKLTFTSLNDGTFINGDAFASKYEDVITKGESNTQHDVRISAGNRIKIECNISDSGRVLSGLKVYETASETPLGVTKTYQSFSRSIYEVDSPAGTDITVEATYSTVNRIKVEIRKKDQTGETTTLKNDTDIYATVVGEGASTTALGYQFKVGSTNCDSFDVRKDLVEAQTAGSTKLTIDVHGLEGTGYVVANVDARYMTSSGSPGTSSDLIEARNDLSDSYGTYLNFEHCTLTMPDRNMYIRIYIAKTTQVTVNFNSRMGGTDTPFAPNQVSSSIIDMKYTASVYGSGVRPVTITNAGNQYNGDSYTITSNPSSRTVTALHHSRVQGTVSIPDGYLIASVVTTRTNGSETETVGYTVFDCEYDGEQYEGSFKLNSPVEYGWDYTIDVNIETVTKVKLEIYHSDQNGSFLLNTVTDSSAKLTGTRGGSEADAPYDQTAYQSSAPFAPMTGNQAGMTSSITADKKHNTLEYYVLRNTAYTVTAIPAEGDEVYQVKAVNAAAQTQTYAVTSAGDDGSGHPTFTVDSLSQMGEEMIIRVYFTDTRAFGRVKVENYDIEGDPISLPVSATMIMNVSHPIYVDEPAYDMQNGSAPVKRNVSITGATAHYMVTVGSTIKVTLDWAEDYYLYSYKLRYKDGHEDGPFYSGKNMHYEVKPAVSDDSEITIVNYFIKTASVNQEAYYSDVAGNLTPKKRFTKSTDKYYSLFFEDALLMNDNSLFSKNLNTKSGMDHGYFASGPHSGYSLRIKENAGYTLSKLKLSCSGVGDWELTREQLTNVQVPDTGDNVIDFDISKVKKGVALRRAICRSPIRIRLSEGQPNLHRSGIFLRTLHSRHCI